MPSFLPSSPLEEGEPQIIVSRDESNPIDENVKPLILDMLRTKYCIQGSIFLVEAIDRRVFVRKRRRAMRLVLGDGELCIQALVKPDIHCFVDNDQVFEGCYVTLDKFELREVDITSEDERDREMEMEKAGEGGQKGKKMAYLLVRDMITVGWNRELLKMEGRLDVLDGGGDVRDDEGEEVGAEEEETAEVEDQKKTEELQGESEKGENFLDHEEEFIESGLIRRLPDKPSKPRLSPQKITDLKRKEVKEKDEPDYISDSDDETYKELAIFSALQQEKAPNATTARAQPEPPRPLPFSVPKRNQPETPEQKSKRPWQSNDPTQPLKLTDLHSIPNLPYKQNWMVNVLAVVVSLSDVLPCPYPPYTQRTARLADMSTDKHVHLTVFLDPESFTPEINGVVLLMGVKNHRFEGGSLKKYVSDRPKNGRSWWVQRPEELGWCTVEVERLNAWWMAKELEDDMNDF